jgi:adenylyltransferase/sulfurtransferase
MLSKNEKERYNRHLILPGFGDEAQNKLKNSKVLVVGAGGLGCPALLYLTAAGVGTIGIADNDVVSISNLQRQILFTPEDLDENKAIVAKEKLETQNPHIRIKALPYKLDKNNVLDIVFEYDLVIDGSDNFSTRYLLNDACVILKKPLVYGAIHQFEGQVSVFNYKDGPTYRCLFPEPPSHNEMPACNEAGVIGVLPGIVGTWQATEAVKIIAEIGQVLSGKLLTFDLLTNTTGSFEFVSNETNKKMTTLGNYSFDETCAIKELDLTTLKNLSGKIQLVDVREASEYAEKNLNGINIPLSELEERMHEIDPNLSTVIHCKTGIRSQKAIAKIKQQYPSIEIYNLAHPF